jgi:hypothetical protein
MRTHMSTSKKSTNSTPPSFTRDELVILNNALNEVCHALSFSEDEFQTRIGYTRAIVEDLLKKISRALEA